VKIINVKQLEADLADARERNANLLELVRSDAAEHSKLMAQIRRERDEARACARVLAHAYTTDNRPPARVVEQALAYPEKP
jgi:hypothetical protein